MREEIISPITQMRGVKHKERETICSRFRDLTLGLQVKSQVIFPKLQVDLANYLYQVEVHLSHRLRMAKILPAPEI